MPSTWSKMGMSQQDAIQPPEAGAAAEQLALCAFATIHQNPMTARLDEKPRMIASGRRNTCRRAEKSQVEHRGGPYQPETSHDGKIRIPPTFLAERNGKRSTQRARKSSPLRLQARLFWPEFGQLETRQPAGKSPAAQY
jgi:hypothetical protein